MKYEKNLLKMEKQVRILKTAKNHINWNYLKKKIGYKKELKKIMANIFSNLIKIINSQTQAQ